MQSYDMLPLASALISDLSCICPPKIGVAHSPMVDSPKEHAREKYTLRSGAA